MDRGLSTFAAHLLALAGEPELDPEKLTRRLLHRAAEQHRTDDKPESIAERLDEYQELTTPVLDYYRERGVPMLEIDGSGSIEEVHQRIAEALHSLRR